MLKIYSLSEIEPHHLIFSERIDFLKLEQINSSPKSLLYYYGIPFKFRIVPKEVLASWPGRKIGACYSYVTWYFKDKDDDETKSIGYYLIDLCAPNTILDVLLYHELREIFYVENEGLSDEEAHEKARREEVDYIKTFLPPEEIGIYNDFCDEAGAENYKT